MTGRDGSDCFSDEPDRAVLLRQLNWQRRHVLDQLDGLTDEQLRRPVLPSGWTCLGLIRHLTLSDERYWFEVVMAGGDLGFWPTGENGDWHVDDDEPAETIIEAYHTAITNADALISQHPLHSPPQRPEPWWSEAGLSFPDLRTVIVETATHAGQLDAVRELIDGQQPPRRLAALCTASSHLDRCGRDSETQRKTPAVNPHPPAALPALRVVRLREIAAHCLGRYRVVAGRAES